MIKAKSSKAKFIFFISISIPVASILFRTVFNLDEFAKSRIHQVLGVKFHDNDIICFKEDLNLNPAIDGAKI